MSNEIRITNMTTKRVLIKLEDDNGNYIEEKILKLVQKFNFTRNPGNYKLSVINLSTKKEEIIFQIKSPGVYQVDKHPEHKDLFKLKDNLNLKDIFHLEIYQINFNTEDFLNIDNIPHPHEESKGFILDHNLKNSNILEEQFKKPIKISNNSNDNIILKLTYENNQIKRECSFISKKETKIFLRNQGIEYELNIESLENLRKEPNKDNLFLVKTETSYFIDKTLDLFSEDGIPIVNEMENKNYYDKKKINSDKKEENSQNSGNKLENSTKKQPVISNLPENVILFKNNSEKEIKITLQTANKNFDKNFFIFKKLFNRIEIPLNHIHETLTVYLNDAYYFYVKSQNEYTYTNNYQILNSTGDEIDLLIINNENNQKTKSEKINTPHFTDKIIQKLNQEKLNNPLPPTNNDNNSLSIINKFKLKQNKIEFIIRNEHYELINIRIQSDGFASEDFFSKNPGEFQTFKRLPNEDYLIEIIDDDDNASYRFYLTEPGEYVFTQDKDLINLNTDQLSEPTDDVLEASSQIMTFDGLIKDINYDKLLEKIKNSDNKNNIFKNASSKVFNQENKIEENEILYFDNIQPNYSQGQKFIDSNFIADITMIDPYDESNTRTIRQPHFTHSENESNLDNFVSSAVSFLGGYQRPDKIFKKQYYLFKDTIEPNDVIQGTIGNCYLVSIFSALAERPELIQRIFKTKSINPDGFYEIFYYYQNKKYIMFIDDIFPTFDKILGNKKMLFAEPNGEEIWVSILEKAYAKFEGGYVNIIGGLIYPELEFFTGCKTEEISTNNANCWEKLQNAAKERYIVCCRSKRKENNTNSITSKNNIVYGHAYTILDAKEFKNVRLVQIRNPYGASTVDLNGNKVSTEWCGDYSDDSKLWNEELKEFFDFKIAYGDNGIFFMSFNDFMSEFDSLVIGYI